MFQNSQSMDSLFRILEKDFPGFQMHNSHQITNIESIQLSLPDSTGLVEYFLGDSNLFVFLITTDHVEFIRHPHAHDLKIQIESFRNSIYHDHLKDEVNQAEEDSLLAIYSNLGYELYQTLLAPLADKLPRKLIIVPDGELGYIPFETLLTEPEAANKPLWDLPYLIHQYTISYAYSATSWLEMSENRNTKPSKSGVLAFAPQFNREEVESINQKLGGKIFADTSATLSNFFSYASRYPIIHLATHSKINELKPESSFLAFYGREDSVQLTDKPHPEVSHLFLADLYNLQLNADLVVLSASETGIGKLLRGEGILSLARGFSYAGARSTVSSLWQVSDQSSTEWMKSFYNHLNEGLSKDEAIRQAKLDMIKENPHPFYWAGFIGTGDMSPIAKSGSWGWWFVLGVVGLGLCYLYFRRR